ncbi:MAG: alpha/beta hydrolase [Hyphomicrobiaceae bacterium]|nr:alpha/beta hydrolase [Hyphomicrobiaceae bacterium]
MKLVDTDILLVPGLGNSGPGHWQRRWLEKFPHATWVEQDEWDEPDRDSWIAALHRAILMATRPVVLIGHSLGNHAIVQTAAMLADTKIKGALLVSPPDLEHPDVPPGTAVFRPMSRDPLPFASLMIVSDTDPYCSVSTAGDLANCWGSELHVARDAGHINVASGHGLWPDGLMMLGRLLKRV